MRCLNVKKINKIEAVFFDAGLVILSPNGDKIKELLSENIDIANIDSHDLVDAYTRTIHKRDQMELVDYSDEWFWTTWCNEVGVPEESALIIRDILVNYDKKTSGERLWNILNPDVKELFGYLKSNGVKVGIISNSDGRLDDDLKLAGLTAFIDVAIDSEKVGVSKPNHKIFEIACEKARIQDKNNVCFVGDELRNDIIPSCSFGFDNVFHYDRLGIYEDSTEYTRIRKLKDIKNYIGDEL